MWYCAGMLPRRLSAAASATVAAVLSIGSIAASQPIEPLGATRPAAPPAPADVGEAPADATKTASGLAWKVLVKPKGTIHPGAHDKVTINFTGWSPDGAVIASSIPDGEPWTLLMDDAIKGISKLKDGQGQYLWSQSVREGEPDRILGMPMVVSEFVPNTFDRQVCRSVRRL